MAPVIRRGGGKIAPTQTRPSKTETDRGNAVVNVGLFKKHAKDEPQVQVGGKLTVKDLESLTSDQPLGHVRIAVGSTISLGNFEFLRVDVAVQLPCTAQEDSVLLARDRASQYAEEFLRDEEQRYSN